MQRITQFLSTLLVAIALVTPCRPTGAAALLPELDASSPHATYRSFLAETNRIGALYVAYRSETTFAHQAAMGRAFLRLGPQLFDLSAVPPVNRAKAGAAAVGYLADILNCLPEIPAEAIPGAHGGAAAALPTRWTIPGTEIRIVRLTEGPRAGDYVFSAETVARLPEFHAQIIGEPPLRSTDLPGWRATQLRFAGPLLTFLPLASLPAPFQTAVLGTPVWKVLLALLVVVAVLIAVLAWSRLVRRWTSGASAWWRHAAWLTVPAMLAVLVQVGHAFNTWQVVLSGPVSDAESILASLALYAAAAWAAWVACWLVVEAIIASPTIPDDSYDANLLRLVARVTSLLAAGTLVVLGANDVGVPALGLLAGVSIGGVALALAAQSTVENLFGGVSIFADRPFRIGDSIRYGGSTGKVEAIGPRSSRIRGLDGTLTTVPNADLAKMHVTNLTTRTKFLFQHRIGLRYETSRAQLEGVLGELRRRVAAHPRVETATGYPRIRLVGLGESSIDIELYAHVLTSDFLEFLGVQEELILEVMNAVEESGSGFAFRSLTAYLARDGGLDVAGVRRAGQRTMRSCAETDT